MKHWHLLHTRPREDARACQRLSAQGYEVYQPRLAARRRRSHGMTNVIEPLFPRYVFIRLDDTTQNWAPIRSTPGVASLVRFGDIPACVPAVVVDSLKARTDPENGCVHAEAAAETLRRDAPVRVIDGPFQHLEGIFSHRRGADRVVILLRLLDGPRQLTLSEHAIRAL